MVDECRLGVEALEAIHTNTYRNGLHQTRFRLTRITTSLCHRLSETRGRCAATVAVADLQLDTTHHGRVLRGTLVEKPCFSGSIGLLLQDDTGDMVTVRLNLHSTSNTTLSLSNSLRSQLR